MANCPLSVEVKARKWQSSRIDRFTNLIYQNFKVLKNNLRYSVDDYNGRHIVVALTEEKLKLPEYSRFKDLRMSPAEIETNKCSMRLNNH